MKQQEYEAQADPKKLPPGTVIIENYRHWEYNGIDYFEVFTCGQHITYGCTKDGVALHTLDDHGNFNSLSVFRRP